VYGGKRVLVLERHYAMGGFTHTFHRPGYEWDVGLHYIGQVQDETSSVRRAFDHVTEGKVRWNAMPEVYDRMIVDGQTFDLTRGLEQYREGMKRYFPSEGRAIDKYIAAVQSSNRAAELYYAEKAVPVLLSRIAGGLMRAPFLRWAKRTTGEVLSDLTSNRELIGVLTGQWGDYGLPPAQSSFGIHATIAGHYFDGGSYPVGGAATIAAAIAPAIERSGGRVITSAEVANILIDGEKAIGVKMANGRELLAPIVISDAGAANTFLRRMALGNPLSRLQQAFARLLARFHKKSLCFRSSFVGARFDAAGAVAYSVVCNRPEHCCYQVFPVRWRRPSQRLLECRHRLKCPLEADQSRLFVMRLGCLGCHASNQVISQ
jgi:all-trans-retinol 13,14-reductase